MRFNDAVIGVLTILLSLIVIIHVQSYPAQPGGRPGPALFPIVLSVLLMIAGSVLIVDGRRSRAPLFQILPELDAKGAGNIMLFLAAIVFYIVVSETLGFLATSFVVMVSMMSVLKARLKLGVPVAAGTTVLIYLIFNKILLVPLPRGILAF
ncbi:MAG: tripartite tricarboxylate transporter TctB family protein [Deltaproteobacteria bacterium]|jgi:putative tricarboxylic transport membrane protein|nr:tripartite tricarboxylate transporter TctB family protein [Deltaproteobacteria bacterium]